jgi:hypothetical protein
VAAEIVLRHLQDTLAVMEKNLEIEREESREEPRGEPM